jgi:uncharacterized protein (TIGR02266 family)
MEGTMKNSRKHERVPKKTKTKVHSPNAITYSTTHNMSGGGMFVTTPEPIAPGTEIDLAITMPDGAELSLRGVVRWTKDEGDDGSRAGMGIEFVSVKTADEDKITSFLK